MVFLAVASTAVGQSEKSTRDGVYKKTQADRGGVAFQSTCLSCHGEPKFASDVLDKMAGTSVAELFDFMSTQMPQDNPGALKPGDYADILACFLSLRGLPAGEAELVPDLEVLKQIKIQIEAP
jgi:hypothetical protein